MLSSPASVIIQRANWRSAFSAASTLAGARNAASRCRYRWIVAATCGAAARICAHCAAAMLPGTARLAAGPRAGSALTGRPPSCTASISATAAVSASISSAARRYSVGQPVVGQVQVDPGRLDRLRCPAWACTASSAIPASRSRVRHVCRSSWQVACSSPARRRAPARISSSPSADSGRPRRGPFSTTNTRSVRAVSGRSSCR